MQRPTKFKATIEFTIDWELIKREMEELGIEEEGSPVDIVLESLVRAFAWTNDSGFYLDSARVSKLKE